MKFHWNSLGKRGPLNEIKDLEIIDKKLVLTLFVETKNNIDILSLMNTLKNLFYGPRANT